MPLLVSRLTLNRRGKELANTTNTIIECMFPFSIVYDRFKKRFESENLVQHALLLPSLILVGPLTLCPSPSHIFLTLGYRSARPGIWL